MSTKNALGRLEKMKRMATDNFESNFFRGDTAHFSRLTNLVSFFIIEVCEIRKERKKYF